MKLTIIGYMGGYPANGIGTSSYLLESEGYHLLIDAGSGSLLALENHLDPLELDALLLSHYHYDHIADTGVIIQTRKLKRKNDGIERAPILPIYGHQNSELFCLLTEERVSQGIAYDGEEFSVGPFQIRTLKTLHPVTCYAFRIEERRTGKVLLYTADTGYMDETIAFSTNADLLLADTNLYEGMEWHSSHMTFLESGRIAREAGVKKLILTHLPPEGKELELLEQAKREAGNIPVLLAQKDLVLTI